jgi:hypothetical protein
MRDEDWRVTNKTIDDILKRIAALESAVGKTKGKLDRRLNKQQAAEREGVTPRTLDRRRNDPSSGFPPAVVINGRCFFWLSDLERYDEECRRRGAAFAPVVAREKAT